MRAASRISWSTPSIAAHSRIRVNPRPVQMVTNVTVKNAHFGSVRNPIGRMPNLPIIELMTPVEPNRARNPRDAAATDTLTIEVMATRSTLMPMMRRVSRIANSTPSAIRPTTTSTA